MRVIATILIAGGATGIGRASLQAFRAQGDNVFLVDINREEAEAACVETGAGAAEVLIGDLTDPALPKAAIEAALEAFGSLDTVFVNAGLLRAAALTDWTLADWQASLAVNLTAPFLFAQAAAPALRGSPNPSLLFTSSTGALRGHAGMPAYHATKAGLVGLCRSLADELSPQGIRVNCLLPGWVDTPFNGPFWSHQPDKQLAERDLVAGIPLRRQGTAEELAATVLFLASPAAAYITGASLVVDGGYTAV
ncbi:3-oxoacyl-[acyl-carrier protein] reductase [Angulomicrobium tetraedrale]|uniref:3-oxoacyl-[acyl-carrier protein] reductase n=1 Tax=Ancylobacter tetraedralis TaxID=217068 RepID=A0A839ZA51_9HYPH|nr:3-oxoacyl-[acyl-carrier protein] reductase [Ancylobacter tetraedralis]